MSIWAVILIVVSIALFIGPIMMFRPSKRDSRLAALRQAAIHAGIGVRLRDIEVSGTKQSVAEYLLPYADKEQGQQGGSWLLLKQGFVHEAHFLGRWDWEESEQTAPLSSHPILKKQIGSLPDYIGGIGANPKGVYVLWNEAGQSLNGVLELLSRLRDM